MLLGSRLSRHFEEGVLSISCLVCLVLQTHMLPFLARTLGQIVFPR